MSLPITPTTQDISDNIIAQLEASLSQTIPLLPKAFNRVLAKALAGVFVLLYKYANWMFLQMFVGTASFSETTVNGHKITPLIEWGRLCGAGDPLAATRAEMTIDVTVENTGGSLPQGSQLINPRTGVVYITLAAVSLSSGTVTATIRAVSDQEGNGGRGDIGNMPAGETLSFANPLPDVARDVVVNTPTVTGADGEAEAAYRSRVLARFRQRPQGGALADYAQWALLAEGITAVYPYTGDPGEVDVYCEAGGETDGIPTTPQLQDVEDTINLDSSGLASRRPANALVNALPITRTAFNVEVADLVVDDAPTVQGEIEDACEAYFLSLEPFILGLSVLPRSDVIAATALAGTVYDIVADAGGTFTGLVIKEGMTPITLRTLGTGEKAKAGTVSFV